MWKWNSRARRYYDGDTGQFMPRDTVLGYVGGLIETAGPVTDILASLVIDVHISPADWHFLMREEIKREYISQYLLGIGGRAQMLPADWGSIGGMLKEQYGHLDGFLQDILDGKLSEAQIAARSKMYSSSAREAYERANGRAWGDPPLPAFPGDGSTACLTMCACNWDIRSAEAEEERMRWTCYWRLGFVKTEHCTDCIDRALSWGPLIVEA